MNQVWGGREFISSNETYWRFGFLGVFVNKDSEVSACDPPKDRGLKAGEAESTWEWEATAQTTKKELP